jgi:hypothetical protein
LGGVWVFGGALDRQTGRQADRWTDRWTGRQADRWTDKWTGRQADRQTGGQVDRWTGRQADRQTGRQTRPRVKIIFLSVARESSFSEKFFQIQLARLTAYP